MDREPAVCYNKSGDYRKGGFTVTSSHYDRALKKRKAHKKKVGA